MPACGAATDGQHHRLVTGRRAWQRHPMRRALITGSAGFIGYHLADRLLAAGWRVHGIDGMTPYYDIALKQRRHALLHESPQFTSDTFMLEEAERVAEVTRGFAPLQAASRAGSGAARNHIADTRSTPGTSSGRGNVSA